MALIFLILLTLLPIIHCRSRCWSYSCSSGFCRQRKQGKHFGSDYIDHPCLGLDADSHPRPAYDLVADHAA